MNKYLKNFIENSWSPLFIGLIVILVTLVTIRGFSYLGLFIVIIGELIYVYNNFVMGKTWSVKVETKNHLVKQGFFKYIRHPLYLGALIAAFGFSIAFKSWISILINILVTFPYIYIRSKLEEELLSKTLKGYKDYMNNTGMFFPKFK